jgi:hypothetical protein
MNTSRFLKGKENFNIYVYMYRYVYIIRRRRYYKCNCFKRVHIYVGLAVEIGSGAHGESSRVFAIVDAQP